MATIRGHDLQLQSVQKIMTKAMLPLVRLADSFLLAEGETSAMPSPRDACLDSFSLLADGPDAQKGCSTNPLQGSSPCT